MKRAKQHLVHIGMSVFNLSLPVKLRDSFSLNFFQTLRMTENE
jgi:hypothetical protein